MKELHFPINKIGIYDEVARTTSYTGAKMEGDEGAYERIFTTTADQEQLERFFQEARGTFCQVMRNYIKNEIDMADGRYDLFLTLSSSFDVNLGSSMSQDIRNYYILSITGKWFVYTNKNEAASYAQAAAGMLEQIHRKACHRTGPKRPSATT